MRMDGDESSNIEDRRGSRMIPGGRGGLGLGGIVIALAASYFLGIDPSVVLNGLSMLEGRQPARTEAGPVQASPAEEAQKRFVAQVLRDTEVTWQAVFRQAGREYAEPRLVLFRDATQTACGQGQAAMGPFYCPADQRVYLDLDFFDELERRFKAPGNAAQAYVIAHEVGHHVQNLLGISEKVQRARQSAGEKEGNALSVRLELQADCLAGVWVHHANQQRKVLEAGDIERVLGAASAIGDDTLQKNARGYATPDSFTHGSSAQRQKWFRTGFDAGDIRQCDSFKRGV
ncbi:KPN_02809 family neutral zinc metallopeptidase [Uliginosibacterium aquaticum]|uniref:Neutral zinc metallopeptidase n=1 Tax=Uliginosibacterium aquaticum TaxID=2731212 RepID=A0ABX2ING9_9RHOO|nr:neutral zinc metallopeptidase [Uliginosibacterium aquaticum]NSL56562.1 neutral zinc metallopeptidase [Uliginosibacterium aquaticum]